MLTRPQIGDVLRGRYRIIAHLGEGGMGTVFAAEHLKLHKRVVIKTLHEDFGRDPTFRARFRREAQATSIIDHKNIVNVIDADEDGDTLYYVMEHLDGEDLSKAIERDKRLPWARVRGIGQQMCAALAAAHVKRIIHRDLKPSNCFLIRREENDDFVKIIDFGIAQLIDTTGQRTYRGIQREHEKLTRAGQVFGTPTYMSPEHYFGEPTDHRTDIYAVGCILYQLLTGVPPIAYGQGFAQRLQSELPVPPSERAPDAQIPLDVDRLILKALAKRPEDRYASMDAMGVAPEWDGEVQPLRPEPRSPRPSSHHRPARHAAKTRPGLWLALGVGSLLLLMLALTWGQCEPAPGLQTGPGRVAPTLEGVGVTPRAASVETVVAPPTPAVEFPAAPPTLPAVAEPISVDPLPAPVPPPRKRSGKPKGKAKKPIPWDPDSPLPPP